jgi:arabinose-5-phosphate isomerase
MSPSANPAETAAAVGARDATLRRGREVLEQEAAAVADLARRLDGRFAQAVELLANCPGRVIVSGVGKSGVIARKIAATLTSTGTPAVFLHPVDSVHGDLGIVSRDDAAIAVSKSGETDELMTLVAHLKRLGVPVVAITGASQSALARHADVALDAAVEAEACPFDLAPTTSTTVALALGDALAVALFEAKGFKKEDFARLHPGGALGRRLLLTVRDVMLTEALPALLPGAAMRECVILLAERRGTVAVVDASRRVVGVVTAGDLTRLMEREDRFLEVPVERVMNRSPKLARPEELAGAAVYRMERHGIMAMPVVDGGGVLVGMVHLHDLMRAGAA